MSLLKDTQTIFLKHVMLCYVLFLYVIFVQLCFKLPQRVPENMQFHLFAHKPRAVIQLL